MHGRAVREGWLDREQAERIVELLMLHAQSDKPRTSIAAIDELVKIRALDLKQQELELKQKIADDKRRIELLGKLADIDPGKLAERARVLGLDISRVGRAVQASGVDGEEASEG